jgi:restriction system protein
MKLPKYKYLLTYRYAEVVHDLTEEFCRQFLGGRENLRLREQMRSAARSNKQNIVEGVSQQTSLKGQIKLLGVAQASTEELVADYEDFLRQRKLLVWEKSQPEVNFYRQLGWEATSSYPPKLLRLLRELRKGPEAAGNLMLTLAHQLSFLLSRQIRAAEKKFIEKGGYSENLFRKRISFRRG